MARPAALSSYTIPYVSNVTSESLPSNTFQANIIKLNIYLEKFIMYLGTHRK